VDPSDDFSTIVLETQSACPCSPSLRGLGVFLRAPAQVAADAPFQIPLCIAWLLDAKWMPEQGPLGVLEAVVEHPEWSRPRVIPLTPEGWLPPDPDEREPMAPGLRVGGYYNPDLVAHGGLLRLVGCYRIRVRLGGLRSRPVEVSVLDHPAK